MGLTRSDKRETGVNVGDRIQLSDVKINLFTDQVINLGQNLIGEMEYTNFSNRMNITQFVLDYNYLTHLFIGDYQILDYTVKMYRSYCYKLHSTRGCDKTWHISPVMLF